MGIIQKLFVPDEGPGKSNIGHPFDQKPEGSEKDTEAKQEHPGSREGNPRVYAPAVPPFDSGGNPTKKKKDEGRNLEDIMVLYGPAPDFVRWSSKSNEDNEPSDDDEDGDE